MITGLFIGNELCEGRILNSNQYFIAKTLYDHGFYLNESLTVDDCLESLTQTFKRLIQNTHILITTGGLGPTEDDRTTQALATACSLDIERDLHVLDSIKAYFAKTQRTMPTENEKQADFPKGAQIIPNLRGTAPGYSLTYQEVTIFVCPGPPNELEPMLHDYVIPFLKKHYAHLQQSKQRKLYNCIGIGESHCAERIRDIYPLTQGLSISFQAKPNLIQVRLDSSLPKNDPNFINLCSQLDQRFDDICFSNEETQSLEEVIIRRCQTTGLRIACAESCTGGLLSQRLISISGASEVCDLNIVTYSDSAKQRWLHVDPSIITSHGAVSKETVAAMANGLLKTTEADITIAISGIAGPGGGSPEKPVGTVFFAIATKQETFTHHRHILGSRNVVQNKAASIALSLIYNTLKTVF